MQKPKNVQLCLRLREDYLALVDEDLQYSSHSTRTTWVQEAIYRELVRRGYLSDTNPDLVRPRGGGGRPKPPMIWTNTNSQCSSLALA